MIDDWFPFLEALLDAGARFLVVGAHATAVHGAELIATKRATDRPKDRADLHALGEDPGAGHA